MPYLFQMDLQDRFSSLQIGQFHLDTTVETSRAQQGLIQAFRAVGRRQDHHALTAIETIHLGQELVQRLLTLVVRAHATLTALANSVDLVDENDARRLLIGLPEQITYLGGAHTHKHLDKLRS